MTTCQNIAARSHRGCNQRLHRVLVLPLAPPDDLYQHFRSWLCCSVAAGCLAERGCRVIGVDVHPEKIARIQSGRAPIHEPNLDPLLEDAIREGRLGATDDAESAVGETDVSVICVGTPCDDEGALNLTFVETVAGQIRAALGEKPFHRIVFRSTMLPGSTRSIAERFFGELIADGRVEVFFFPEFLRQGSAVRDFKEPSLSVVGVYDEGQSIDDIAELFDEASQIVTLEEAELLKYACNAFHATKVSFANEIGRLGKALEIDSRRVMEMLCLDDRLNISRAYLRPGNPFGGSCLPKDVSALNVLAEKLGVTIPTLASLTPSNDAHRSHLLSLVRRHGGDEIVIVGLAFKHDTDDLRGSALLPLAADLLREGKQLRIYDPLLDPESLVGASKAFAEQQLPSLADLMKPTLAEALGERGIVLASNRCIPAADLVAALSDGHHLIDVSGWAELEELPVPGREGICW